MNAISKLIATSAFVASVALASSASAATIINFAQYQQQGNVDTLAWKQSAKKTGGKLEDIGDPTVIFRIWDTSVAPGDVVEVLATMQFNGTVDNGTPAQSAFGDKYQSGLYGTFSFTAKEAFTRNGVDYGVGANLLSAVFSGGTISGAGTGFVSLDALKGATVDYTSAVIDPKPFELETFTLSLNAIHRGKAAGLAYTAGQSLQTFTTTTTGQFAAAAVPEPATWSMMLLGFFGAGSLIRNRRRAIRFA